VFLYQFSLFSDVVLLSGASFYYLVVVRGFQNFLSAVLRYLVVKYVTVICKILQNSDFFHFIILCVSSVYAVERRSATSLVILSIESQYS